MEKINVGIIGGTGMVGQNYIRLLENHPWFNVTYIAASPRSAGKTYTEAVEGRWYMPTEIPSSVKDIMVEDASDVEKCKDVNFVFSAVEMSKDEIRAIENEYAAAGIPVVSNNSAHRWTDNVPMLIPEINPGHIDIIPEQQKANGWDKGFVVVKPNCSLQSYMAPVYALMKAGYDIDEMIVTTMQAISGAGKTFDTFPEIVDNVIPYIGGEEEKSEKEPLKILGSVQDGKFVDYDGIKISAHCNRVPASDGHMACCSVKFKDKKPSLDEIKKIWAEFKGLEEELPFAPEQDIIYKEEDDRPQTKLDRDNDKGMAVTVGRLREDNVFDIKFVALSHNTVRGAAGGGILNAELLYKKGLF